MINHKGMFVIILMATVVLSLAPAASYASEKLFIDNKCNKCHAVSAIGIQKAGGEDEEAGDEKAGPPDLSDIGTYTDAAFLTSFLKKEAAGKNKDGSASAKKHPVKFKGTDAELTELAGWLAGLKQAPK